MFRAVAATTYSINISHSNFVYVTKMTALSFGFSRLNFNVLLWLLVVSNTECFKSSNISANIAVTFFKVNTATAVFVKTT
jgi:hypothetical protein